MQAMAEVVTLPDFETDICFPPGPAGILLEPVVRCGNRAIGARIVGFAPSSEEIHNQDLFVQKAHPASSAAGVVSPSAHIGDLAAEHLNVGAVLVSLDDVCTKSLSFDRIMVSLRIQC